MVFNIHYVKNAKAANAGEILSYQEGPDKQTEEDVPPGCALLSFQSVPDGFFDKATGLVLMRVDQGQLVSKRPAPLPL